jgi:hypothetical protein
MHTSAKIARSGIKSGQWYIVLNYKNNYPIDRAFSIEVFKIDLKIISLGVKLNLVMNYIIWKPTFYQRNSNFLFNIKFEG